MVNTEDNWVTEKFGQKRCKILIWLSMALSLGMLVPNSRDQHEKKWQLKFTHHKTHPKIRFV